MNRYRWILFGLAAAVVLWGAWLFLGPRTGTVIHDLVAELATADPRPSPAAFSVVDATLNGDTKKAILIKDPSRLTYKVAVPDNAWLRVNLGLLEESWTVDGDGVLFMVGVSYGTTYEELLSIVINPRQNAGDRGWQEVMLDLSPYAGSEVNLLLQTRSSPDVRPPRDDRNGDLAVWGTPAIVVR